MISTLVRVQVDKDGTVKLPSDLWQEMGVEQPREVQLFVLVPTRHAKRVPKKLSLEERAKFDRAAELLRASYAGADMEQVWKQIKHGRRDKW